RFTICFGLVTLVLRDRFGMDALDDCSRAWSMNGPITRHSSWIAVCGFMIRLPQKDRLPARNTADSVISSLSALRLGRAGAFLSPLRGFLWLIRLGLA